MRNVNLVAMLAFGIAAAAFAAPCLSAFAKEVPKSEQERVSHIAQDGMAEVKLGQLAESKASGAEVKKFAKHMVTDHGKANSDLKVAAKEAGITLPADVNAEQKAMFESLSKMTGKAFDDQYMAEMCKGHEKAVDAVSKESTEGSGTLKAWAEKTLPTIKEHKKEADSLNSKLSTK